MLITIINTIYESLSPLLIFCMLIIFILYKLRIKPIKNISYPPYNSYLGHVPFVITNANRILDADVEQIVRYGPTYQLLLPFQYPNVRTCNPANIKHILHDNIDNYVK